MKKLAFLVSGGGTNMQAIFDAIDAGQIDASPVCVISSKADAFALERARRKGIATYVVASKGRAPAERDAEIAKIADAHGADYLVLAGYLSVLTAEFTARYPHRILNIHPALLPKFGGAGMYGIRVHEAVLAAGETVTGATVHYVDAGTDTGEIIAQRKVAVLPGDTPESLQLRVLDQAEHLLFPEVLARLCNETA